MNHYRGILAHRKPEAHEDFASQRSPASVGLGVFSGVIRGVVCAFFSGVVMCSWG